MRIKALTVGIAVLLAAGLVAGVALGAWRWLLPGDRSTTAAERLSVPIVFRTPGGLLEVASVNTSELLERKSTLIIAGINVGTTVSQIRVPATYRYHIALGPEWRAYMSDGRFLVIAPAVKPSLPVAIDTGQIQMQTSAGWARFNAQANQEALLREITAELQIKATSPAHIELQREAARMTVTEFATKWLIKQERWKAVTPGQVKVYFADEPIEKLRGFGPEFAGSM